MSVVVVVLPKPENGKKIKKILTDHGVEKVFACQTASSALQEISGHDFGLVLCGYRLKDMYYTELAECLPKGFELVLLGSADAVSQTDGRILSLTVPVKVYDLVNTVGMVLKNLEQREKKGKKRTEREENYIRNAKFLLMDRNHLTEEEAYRYIQKTSMNSGTNMVETAQMLLTLMFQEG